MPRGKAASADRDYRETAAAKKRDTLTAQVRALHPSFALPFASMIYFSNVENAYLNDAMNTPRVAADTLAAAGATPAVLYPGDAWEIGTPHDNAAALSRYDQRYAELAQLPLRGTGDSVATDQLQAAFATYHARLFAQNSRWLVKLLSKAPKLDAFRPLAIRLYDIDTLVSFSQFDGITVLAEGKPDVTMHSSSLLFLLKNDFGYDTLTVNGRFEVEGSAAFAKMTRSFGIGLLNAMGLSVSLRLIFELRVMLILLKRLHQVLTRMKAREAVREPA